MQIARAPHPFLQRTTRTDCVRGARRVLPSAAVALALSMWSPPLEASGSSKSSARRGGATATATRAKRSAPATTGRPATRRITARRSAALRTSSTEATKPARDPRAGTRPDGRLTRAQREQAAVDGVRRILRPWIPRGLGVDVRLSIHQIQLNPKNRLLGRGPVDIVVSPRLPAGATTWQRIVAAVRPSVNRRMMVAVSDGGYPTVLSDEPNAIQHRFAHFVTDRVPLPEIVHDVLTSKQSQAGLIGALGSILAFSGAPTLAGAGLVAATGFIMNGRRERSAARTEGMAETVAWARAREQAGNLPALSETYRYYKLQLEDRSTKPLPFRQFVERLTLEEFRN